MRFQFRPAMAALVVAGLAITASAGAGLAQSKGKITFGLEVPLSIVNVPNFMAIEKLKAAGYQIETVNFQSPETMTLALQNGQVDIINTSAGTAFSAIDAGFKGKVFLGQSNADFVMVARKEFTTCSSLDGKRVAVQSREGTTGVLAIQWFMRECPNARPNIMIVPGSENRVAGLIAGQLDASPIDSQNTAQLMQRRPGEFAIIDSFSSSTVLLASVFVASSDWLTRNKTAAADFSKAYVESVNQVNASPALLAAEVKKIVPTIDAATLDTVAKGWVDRKVFNPIGGVQPATIKAAIDFYGTARPYRIIKAPEDAATAEFVTGLR
jgi:ABC-type nitrate/sulfonate/bicarbonate transport system substrate-binding protein